jgi:transcriptional regulator with XRE-family HTH domain
MSTDEVLDAFERYTQESSDSDGQIATDLGIRRSTLKAWLSRQGSPDRCLIARLAGFLRRAGYL